MRPTNYAWGPRRPVTIFTNARNSILTVHTSSSLSVLYYSILKVSKNNNPCFPVGHIVHCALCGVWNVDCCAAISNVDAAQLVPQLTPPQFLSALTIHSVRCPDKIKFESRSENIDGALYL